MGSVAWPASHAARARAPRRGSVWKARDIFIVVSGIVGSTLGLWTRVEDKTGRPGKR
jgi:hypothetical protein